MAINTFNISIGNSSAVAFNLWGNNISASFLAFGWVKSTNDTAQIDWSSNTAYPTVNPTSVGYEIWQMDDSLQSSAPIFLKIEYGGTNSNGVYPTLWITIGTGWSSNGVLTGVMVDRVLISLTSGGSFTTSRASGAPNRFSLILGAAAANYTLAFSVERSHGADGADDTGGVFFLYAYGVSTRGSQHGVTSGYNPTLYAAWNTIVPTTGGGALSPNINVYPVRCWEPGESYPVWGAVTYVSTDFTAWSIIPVTGYDGVSRSYICAGAVTQALAYGGSGHVAWRYE